MASTNSDNAFEPRYEAALTDDKGMLSRIWINFYRKITSVLEYLGNEYVFTLVNNQAVAANVTGLSFDYQYTSQAVIEYFIQRTTSTIDTISTGVFIVVYRPVTNTWVIVNVGTAGPDATGITLSITSVGQVQYTSTNIGGTPSLSRIVYRVREMAGKSSLYSRVG